VTEKIRMGMIGGGKGASVGAFHRAGADITGDIELVAGAFSSDPDASRAFGVDLGLAADRSYGTYAEMLEREADLPEEERMQFVSIVTPNDSHADASCAALSAGFHVICDKPLAGHLEDALRVEDAVETSGLLFGLTYTYTGYPLAIEARERIAAGEIGEIRRVAVSYLQDWLSRAEDTNASKQATWRSDPTRGGESGAFADIGTHAFNMVEFMTGLSITEIAAELRKVVPGRTIDDDGAAMFRLNNGASGLLSASQVCSGSLNALRIEIYGDAGSIFWAQEEPDTLTIKYRGKPDQVFHPGSKSPYLSEPAIAVCRTPAGHPVGYLEGFANHYAGFARAVRAYPAHGDTGCATVADGVAGMRFIRAALNSSRNQSAWTRLDGDN
jgi:predicted dehydrogenase